jgi:DNA-binding GntR family transcriptional regulator
MITDDPRKWVQIADELRERIDTGVLKPSDRVSITAEVRARGVDRRTVGKALQQLEREGRVARFPAYGYVVQSSASQPGT